MISKGAAQSQMVEDVLSYWRQDSARLVERCEFVCWYDSLRTDRGRDRYPAMTYHRAPHKPFLLLSVMDLIAQGRITQNLIEPSYELVDTFNTYWATIMPPGSTTSMAYPFSRLKTDGFWQRVPKPGFDPGVEYNVKSMARLREMYIGARMDEELFGYLCNLETRERLRTLDQQISKLNSINYEPKGIGGLTARGKEATYIGSLPHQSFGLVLTMLQAGKIKYVILNGNALRYGHASIKGLTLTGESDPDDYLP